MGLTITAKNSTRDFDMSYSGFNRMRMEIADIYDAEFGELYRKLCSVYNSTDRDKYIKEINELLEHSRFENDDDILDFFFASDTKGNVKPKTCGKIYNIIKNHDFDTKTFIYTAHSDGKDYEYLKSFLKNCYEHNTTMRWN